MDYGARFRQLDSIVKPLATSPDAQRFPFSVHGRQQAADAWFFAHDQVLLDPKHSRHHDVCKLSLAPSDFTRMQILGEGQFATVHVARCHINNQLYAMKAISKHKAMRYSQALQLPAERHLHILAGMQSKSPAPAMFAAFQTTSTLYLVIELAPSGSLADRVEAAGAVSEPEVQYWTAQLVEAIAWIHGSGFIHRDIKPANILIAESNRLLLTDFGSAAPLTPGHILLAPNYCQEPVGTPDYIAPEILRCAEAVLVRGQEALEELPCYGQAVDWWSMGVTVFELAAGQPPFYSDSIRATYDAILGISPLIRAHKSNSLIDFLHGAVETLRRHDFLVSRGRDSPDLQPITGFEQTGDSFGLDSTFDIGSESSFTTVGLDTSRMSSRWYGWTYLPSTIPEIRPAPLRDGQPLFSPNLPKTPRRSPLGNAHSIRLESRREGMLACIQHSARKQRRRLEALPRSFEEDLQALQRGLQDLSGRLRVMQRTFE